MSAPIADGVMAATYKLVQQAMTGQWQEVPKTVAERRLLLDRLSSTARPQDQQWLSALKQAMSESDAAVAQMASTAGTAAPQPAAANTTLATETVGNTDVVSAMLDMLAKGR
jgi:hypothetical protein